MRNYYIRYEPKAEINYIYLFYLYSLAEYNTTRKCFDTVSYSSIRALEKLINDRFGKGSISVSAISRIMNDERYREYFGVDKEGKTIRLQNDIRGMNSFIMLSSSEVDFLLHEKDNLLVKYFLYIKHFCGRHIGEKQDFTAKQFLSYCGYSDKSNSYTSKISAFNRKLQENGIVKIDAYRDELGRTRNIYSLL